MSTKTQHIKIWGKLPYRITEDKPWVFAWCDLLKLNGSGDSETSAVLELRNAIQGFMQLAYEDGTFYRILKDAGFAYHPVDNVLQWAAEGPREPGVKYKSLESEFAFQIAVVPETPVQIEPLPNTIHSLVLVIRGTDQPARAA